MRRIVVILALSIFCAGVSAQIYRDDLPRIRINVKSPDPDDEMIFGQYMKAAIDGTGRYIALTRRAANLESRDDERAFAVSEGVEDDRRGKTELAEYNCDVVVSHHKKLDTYYISASVVHATTTREIAPTKPFDSDLKNKGDYEKVSNDIVNYIIPRLNAAWSQVDSAARSNKSRQERDKFITDNRDNKQYQYWDNGRNTKWFLKNLSFGVRGEYGYGTYKWEDAKDACPPEWDLPTKPDWEEIKARWARDKDFKDRFFRDGQGYWWSKTEGHCEEHIKGRGCDDLDADKTKDKYPVYDSKGKKILRYEQPVKQPAIRCIQYQR
jgi:uncharacterized protein (TIGR02145 family)